MERRFHEQGDITCFYIVLSSEALIPRLISLLKLPKGAGIDDQQACRLDRIIVYTTIEQEAFTLEQLLEMLKQHRIKLNMEMIEQSLARLELGFVLGREGKRQYVYQVPLFQEMIVNESPAIKLNLEIDDWNVEQNV